MAGNQEYNKLKNEIQGLNANWIKLSGQLEQLTKQEQDEVAKIQQLGITDLDGTILSLTTEVAQIQGAVDYSLKQLEMLP